jgi:hypothetical protein
LQVRPSTLFVRYMLFVPSMLTRAINENNLRTGADPDAFLLSGPGSWLCLNV